MNQIPKKADAGDFAGRFREIISDPLNLVINRHPLAGIVEGGMVYLHNGHRVPLSGSGSYYGDFSDILRLNRGVHEPLEEFIFQQMLKRVPDSPTMLELGAYWAHYSMWLKAVRPSASCFLVEPEPTNLKAGQANFRNHGYEGVFIQDKVAKGAFEVDSFLQGRPFEGLTVLHSDVQGFEDQMLDGARQTLTRKAVDYVFISTHSQRLHQDVERQLRDFGYRIEVSSDFENHTTAYDGLVFASTPAVEPVLPNFMPLGRSHLGEAGPEQLADYVSCISRLYM